VRQPAAEDSSGQVTGSFTLDVHGGQPDWERNLEAAQLFGTELERAVNEAEKKPQDEQTRLLMTA
jgi:hypothetical protein